MRPLITLITDFGLRDYFVGAMKGAMLSVHPDVDIVDISHQIGSQDVLEAAFTLRCAYHAFPPHTIHVVVVDPGVGSDRRALIMSTAGHLFVGPDNGVFSLIHDSETVERVISITADRYFRKPVSPTFHGRDIFGPVAAWISRGVELGRFGEEISDCSRLTLPGWKRETDRVIRASVLHVDKFGNLITSISAADLQMGAISKVEVGGREISRMVHGYFEETGGEPFTLVGSAGFYEIGVFGSSAAELLRVQRGAEILVYLR